MALTAAAATAIDEIRQTFGSDNVTALDDGEGGANVLIEGVALGGPWATDSTWVGFRINFTYPYSDVYPHFIRRDIVRRDGGAPQGEAMSPATFLDREAFQLSRRSNRRDPERETAVLKLLKVIEWLRGRP